MSKRALMMAALVAVVAIAAPDAEGGIRFRYSSGHWRRGAFFGGYGTPYYSHYGLPVTYGDYPYTSYYAAPIYLSAPTRLGNLPYIPPGTIYTTDTSARYGYYRSPYRVYPRYRHYGYRGYGFAASYLATAPAVRRQVVATTPTPSASSSNNAPVIHNETRIVVNVTTAGRTETRVVVQDTSWKRGLWRVSSTGGTTTAAPAATSSTPTRTTAPAADPGNSEEALLAALVRGDDRQRHKAARELKRFNNAKGVAALVDALAKDGDADVREEAARSLGAMLARKAHRALWKAAREDAGPDVRDAARESALKVEAYFDIKPKT